MQHVELTRGAAHGVPTPAWGDVQSGAPCSAGSCLSDMLRLMASSIWSASSECRFRVACATHCGAEYADERQSHIGSEEAGGLQCSFYMVASRVLTMAAAAGV